VENLMEKVDEIPVIKDDLFMMNRNTNRLVALITQILDFRKTETNSFRLDFSKVNITELLKDTYTDFAAVAKKRNLHYSIELPESDVYLYADEEALNKIFSNLVDNAVKYASQKVFIRLLPQENSKTELSVEIENDGLAIPDDMKEKIFEPFVRLKETQKRQGTGIGLALAKSLTELHKGKLFLRTSAEEHNIFVVTLPLENTAS
jgi:signal transduction histidine kinase